MSKTSLETLEEGINALIYKTIMPNIVKYYNDEYNIDSTEDEIVKHALGVKQVDFMTGTKSNSDAKRQKNITKNTPGSTQCNGETYMNNPSKKGKRCAKYTIEDHGFCKGCADKKAIKTIIEKNKNNSKKTLSRPRPRNKDLKRPRTSGDSSDSSQESSSSEDTRPQRKRGERQRRTTSTHKEDSSSEEEKKSPQRRRRRVVKKDDSSSEEKKNEEDSDEEKKSPQRRRRRDVK